MSIPRRSWFGLDVPVDDDACCEKPSHNQDRCEDLVVVLLDRIQDFLLVVNDSVVIQDYKACPDFVPLLFSIPVTVGTVFSLACRQDGNE